MHPHEETPEPYEEIPEQDEEIPYLYEPLIRKGGNPDNYVVGVLPLKNTVLFPGVVMPITVGREKSIQLIKAINQSEHKLLGVVTQRNADVDNPLAADMYKIGCLAQIVKMLRMPDDTVTVIVQGKHRIGIEEYLVYEPYMIARHIRKTYKKPEAAVEKALRASLRTQAFRYIDLAPNISPDAKIPIENVDELELIIYLIASHLKQTVEDKQRMLEMRNIEAKAEAVLKVLAEEIKVLELSQEIEGKVQDDLDKQQREFILRQQIKTIQDELGDAEADSIESLKARAAQKVWSEDTQKHFNRELTRLARLNSMSPDYASALTYMDWMLELPWNNFNAEDFQFQNVQTVLDDDHYGLKDVKDRIMEYLAVLKLKADRKAPILCLYGPPGVGKTSLGRSIATALGREYVRISLGGVHDEAEIRGHRRTYIGSMPGRIIQGMKKAKTGNPVFILDEIDKISSNFRGDPASALLEVLDPEQNNTFRDNYLETEYDLSRVMFIATANTLSTIHPALIDRMEIITLSSYSVEEKLEIAKTHLLPKARREHGLSDEQMVFEPEVLRHITEHYTREAGVRGLMQQIAKVCRGVAKQIVLNDAQSVTITEQNITDFLGVTRFDKELYQKSDVPGVAIGLAWTSVGGEILFIESTLLKGSGKLSLSGQLGEVMRESANLAFIYLRSNAEQFGLSHEIFSQWDAHLHIPEGAIPKDGPSAGITMLTALASLFTQRPVRPALAMSGEITLRGKVLPVGGIKEKVLAAVRAGITTIVLCKDNQKDVSEIDASYIEGITFQYVTQMSEVLALTLLPEPAANAKVMQPQVASDK